MIDDQIRACENAKKLLKQPVAVEYIHLGEVISIPGSPNPTQ
jgi:hypothetical protein